MHKGLAALLLIVFLLLTGFISYQVLKSTGEDDLIGMNETNENVASVVPADGVDQMKPYYVNEYYRIEEPDLFKIYGNRDEILENLKYFDFEYFTSVDFNFRYIRVFYILYEKEDDFYLRRYPLMVSDAIQIDLPEANHYWLVTDTIPTMRASIVEHKGLQNVELSYFDSFTKGIRGMISAGGTPNPQKILVSFDLKEGESFIIYNDGEEVIVRTTRINMSK